MPTKKSSISNRDRLIYLHIKHRGVWDDIQFDIATAAELDPDDVRKVLDGHHKAHKDHQFVTYIDENYPRLLTTMDKPLWVLEYTGTLPLAELDTLDSVSLVDSDGWHPIVWLDSGDLAEYFGTHSVPSIWHDDATQLTYVNMGDASNGCAQTAGIVDPTWSLCELTNVAAATSDNAEFIDRVNKSSVQLRLALPSEAGSMCNQLIKSGTWALFDSAEDVIKAGGVYKWRLSR